MEPSSHGGQTRKYLLYVPKTYDRSKPTPLLISLHPAATRPETEMVISRWNDLADEHGFNVVYPSGSDFPRVWPMGPRSLGWDVRFISDLIDNLEAEYNIDPTWIYATECRSAEAWRLPCRADRPIGSQRSERWRLHKCCPGMSVGIPSRCGRSRFTEQPTEPPLPGRVIADHPRTVSEYSGLDAGVARRNQCQGDPIDTQISPSVRRLANTNCAENADVILYTVGGGGHTWPSGKPLPDSRMEELESRMADLESEGGYGTASAGYGLGATLAMILSWQSNTAVIWVLLHGLLSWVYVIYYLIRNWETVKLI